MGRRQLRITTPSIRPAPASPPAAAPASIGARNPATTTRRAPGMPAAISCASAGGVSASPSPTKTSVGQAMAARPGRESGRPMIACCWRRNASGPVSSAMARTRRLSAASPWRSRCTSSGKVDVHRFGEAAGLCEFDTTPPRLRLLRGFRPRSGVEQRQFGDPLRRLPHDLEGDVAAHRQAGERKARRRRGQNAARDGGMRVVTACGRRPSPDRTATAPGFARRKGVPNSSARERERSASCQTQHRSFQRAPAPHRKSEAIRLT